MTAPASQADTDRRILEERARALARPLAAAGSEGAMLELVVFSIGGGRYALETRHVREVARLRDLTPVPGAADFLIGVTSIRGEFLALVDLRYTLGLPAQGLLDLSYLVVVGTERAEFGILTDAVHEVTLLPAAEVRAPPGEARDHLRGVTRDALAVLDGDRLMADERLFVRQA